METLHEDGAQNLPLSVNSKASNKSPRQGVSIRLKATIIVKQKLNHLDWHVRIEQDGLSIAIYGNLSSNRIRVRDRAGLIALLATLNWLRHLVADAHCSILVTPATYALIFGSAKLLDLNNIVREIRETHIALRSDTLIKPHPSGIIAERNRVHILPFPRAAQPQGPEPTSGLRSVA